MRASFSAFCLTSYRWLPEMSQPSAFCMFTASAPELAIWLSSRNPSVTELPESMIWNP